MASYIILAYLLEGVLFGSLKGEVDLIWSETTLNLSTALLGDNLLLGYISSSIGINPDFLNNLEILFSSMRDGFPLWPHFISTKWPSVNLSKSESLIFDFLDCISIRSLKHSI